MKNITSYNKILVTQNEDDKQFLHQKTEEFNFNDWHQDKIDALVNHMREMMHEADGIGLAANQIGLPWRVFVAEVASEEGERKFYAIFNPKIKKRSTETAPMEEGCLSIPGAHGTVERHTQVTLVGKNKRGKKLKIKAWKTLAHVFQHEVDHLDGIVFTDKALELRKKEDNRE